MELLLVLPLLLAISTPAMADVVSYSFPAMGGYRASNGDLVVVTNTSILSPATFLFDAQLFPVFNQSDGFLLLADTVDLWRAAAGDNANTSAIVEASFNTSFTVDKAAFLSSAVAFVILLDSFPPLASHHGVPAPTAGAMSNATTSSSRLATVEIGTVNSYSRMGSPNVGLNVTVSPNRTATPRGLTVWIEYSAVDHHLCVYAATAGEARPEKLSVIDLPVNLPERRTTESAFVGFFADTVRDAVVGIRDWNLTVDRFGPADGRLQRGEINEDMKKSTRTTSSWSWLVALLGVLGGVVGVVSVASVVVCQMVSRRRAMEMERRRQYTKYYFPAGGRPRRN